MNNSKSAEGLTTVEFQRRAAEAKRDIIALVPEAQRAFTAALIEDHVTYRIGAAQAAAAEDQWKRKTA